MKTVEKNDIVTLIFTGKLDSGEVFSAEMKRIR